MCGFLLYLIIEICPIYVTGLGKHFIPRITMYFSNNFPIFYRQDPHYKLQESSRHSLQESSRHSLQESLTKEKFESLVSQTQGECQKF